MDHYHLHPRRTVQDAPSDCFFAGFISALGYHPKKVVRNKTGTHDRPWKRGDPTCGLDKAVLEVGWRTQRSKAVVRAGGKVVQAVEH